VAVGIVNYSGLSAVDSLVLNTTYGALGSNSGPSTSLLTPTQGCNANPIGATSALTPPGIVNLQAVLQNAQTGGTNCPYIFFFCSVHRIPSLH